MLEEELKTYKAEDDEGNEIETVSKEDLEAKETKIKELEDEQKATQEELLKLTNKDHNFEQVKKQAKKKEDEIEEEKKALAEKEKTFVERQQEEYKNDALTDLVGTDKELKEKVLHFYDNELKSEAITKTEIKEKMTKAFRLADNRANNSLNNAVNAGGEAYRKASDDETPALREMATAMGTSDEDKKKYGSNWQPKYN